MSRDASDRLGSPRVVAMQVSRRRFLGSVGAASFAAAFFAACGGDDDDGETTPAPTDSATPGPAESTATAEPAAAAFPVTVEHAGGSTTIETAPQRVVTLSDYQDLDSVLVFDAPLVLYGFTNAWESGNMPWQAPYLDGVEQWDATGDIDLEQIAAAQPDLIVGMIYAEEVYAQLSEIAPTILIDWATPWRDAIRWIGAALGQGDVAEQAIADTEAKLADATAQFEAVGHQAVMVGFEYAEAFYIWGEETIAAKVFADLGVNFVGGPDPSLTEASLEQVNLLEGADIVLSVDSDPAALAVQEESALFRALPAVRAGKYDVIPVVVSRAFTDGFSPLSVDYAIEHLAEILNRAAMGQGKQLG